MSDLLQRLQAHRTVRQAPLEELAWLVERGELRRYAAGEILGRTGERIDHLFIVLSGSLDIHVQRSGGWRRFMEWQAGDVSGILPFSRMQAAPGETRAVEDLEILAVHRSHFPEMIGRCQTLTAICVHLMLDRARHFRSLDLHDEKLASLGRLAAGLAHELNNPASAAARGAGVLVTQVPGLEEAFRELGAMRLSTAEWAGLESLRSRCLARERDLVGSPLEQAEREEALGDWLVRHGVDRAAGEALAETEVSLADLDAATRCLPPERLGSALVALATSCRLRRLASDIERAAARVHELVAAVKGFTYMDQAKVATPVDLARGLSDTVTVLRSKAKAKAVRVEVRVPSGLPEVVGFGGELNQVWANLIDNAIDAVAEGGRVEVSVACEGAAVVVRVVDDGPGIAPELRERMFEPFFTTKPVGEGTGLGLSIARTLIGRNQGEIDVESRPGRTEFRVTLPAGAAPA